MSYMVVYQRDDGSSAIEYYSDLDAAANAAERLRNEDSVDRPRIFDATEVHYDFQTYYRVQVVDRVYGTASLESTTSEDDSGLSFDGTPRDEDDDEIIETSEAVEPVEMSEPVDLSEQVEPVEMSEQVETVQYDASPAQPDVMPPPPEASQDTTTADVTSTSTPRVDVRNPALADLDAPDTANVDTSISGAGVAGGAAAAAGTSKPGLFEKFVSSLESNNSAASDADPSTVADGVNDLADEATDNVNPNRGLFGR